MQMVERATTPPMGFEAELLEAFTTRFPGDNVKARRELALEHWSLAEGLREYLARELEQLGMDRGVRREAASTPTV